MATTSFPDVTRRDVNTVVISTHYAGGADQQRALIDAAAQRIAQPPAELLSINWFASTDGDSVLSYAQWTHEPDTHDWPGVRYRIYRSLHEDNETRVPGSLITAAFDVDGAQRQRFFVDTILAALPPKEQGHPGAISSHFHLSIDGTRVLNYTEWTNEQAHREAGDSGNHDELYEIFANTPGVRPLGGQRYRLLQTLTPTPTSVGGTR